VLKNVKGREGLPLVRKSRTIHSRSAIYAERYVNRKKAMYQKDAFTPFNGK
jgi:hypothetical protein